MKRLTLLVFICSILYIAAQEKPYRFILFGDLHYDAVDCHPTQRPQYQTKETARNQKHWANSALKLISAAASQIDTTTLFALQLGDITQGDAKDVDSAKRQFHEVLGKICPPFDAKHIPLLIVKGNHDFRNPGKSQAFCEEVMPLNKKNLPAEHSRISKEHYAFSHGSDLFLVMDCQDPDLTFAQDVIASHKDIRHLFVFVHFPVLPWPGAKPHACLFGISKDKTQYSDFRKLLAKHNAIVFAAHVHQQSKTLFDSPSEGKITQITLSSMQFNGKKKTFPPAEKEYKTPTLTEAMKKSPFIAEVMNTAYLPFIKSFDLFGQGGYAVVTVKNDSVTYDLYYGNTTKKPAHSWNLSGQ